MNHRRSKGQKRVARCLRPFSTDGPRELLVVSRSRWDKHQRRLNSPWQQHSSSSTDGRNAQPTWQQNSSSSMSGRHWQVGLEEQRAAWSSSEKKVLGAVYNYLERSADVKVDIEALERLIEPEDEEVCPKYILKYSTRGGSNIFPAF